MQAHLLSVCRRTCLWLFVMISLTGYGQKPDLPTLIPASPEASGLAKYINYPVDHSSGLVKIEIPLYEIKAGDLTLPISLSYHPSGIKVNENSGIVGLGWRLNAEPAVTRSVQGLEDEKGYLRPGYGQLPLDSDSEWFFRQRLANSGMFDWEDEQPDEFYYKLLSRSGGFFIGRNLRSTALPKFVTHPYAPISIDNSRIEAIANRVPGAGTIDAFNIVDDSGVRYNFSNVETTVLSGAQQAINTAWKASSISSSVTSQTISFQYQPGNIELMQGLSDVEELLDSLPGWRPNAGSGAVSSGMVGCPGEITWASPRLQQAINVGFNSKFYYWSENGRYQVYGCNSDIAVGGDGGSVNTIRLKEINYNGGKVVFTMKTIPKHGDCIDKIEVYAGSHLSKQFKFNYESFIANPTRNRILLKSIEILDNQNVLTEKYEFNYNHTLLPDYLSKSVDYWGYYNGAANGYTASFVPQINNLYTYNQPYGYNQYVSLGSADREPNFAYAQAMTLTSITYPTGGYTRFLYQPNQYRVGNQVKDAGGLRIHKVIDEAPPGIIERTYTYGQNADGAGTLRAPLNLVDAFSFERINEYYGGTDHSYGQKMRNRTFFSSALTDLFFPGGGSVFYDFVTEYLTDGEGNSLGKTEFKYKNDTNSPYRILKTTVVVDLRTSWMFGQLISKKVYKGNKANGAYTLVASQGYQYDIKNYDNTSINVGKTFWHTKNINYIDFYDPYPFQKIANSLFYIKYEIPTGAMVVATDTAIAYDGNHKLVTINEYTYDNAVYVSPTQVKTKSSDGEIVTTTYRYPHDVTLTGNAETGRQKLLSDGRVGTLLEQSVTKGSAVVKTKTEYGVFSGKAQPAQILTNTGANFSDEQRITFGSYDGNGNLLTVSKASDIKICYLWGYNNLYPVAKIEGIDYSNVSLTVRNNIANRGYTANSTFIEIKADADWLKTQLAALMADPAYNVSIFTYAPMVGMTSQTDDNGVTTYFEYDASSRLKLTRDAEGKILNSYVYNYAQPAITGENYILSNTLLAPVTNENDIDSQTEETRARTIQYFDGLGRPKQVVQMQASPAKNDIVQSVFYDAFGRETKKYLPSVASPAGVGTYRHTLGVAPSEYTSSSQYTFYNGPNDIADDTQPYAVTELEPSPLGRELQVGAPGDVWKPKEYVWIPPTAPPAPAQVATSYPNYSKSYDFREFLPKTGNGVQVPGGGSVTITISNNVLTINFSAGFNLSELQTGRVKLIDVPLLYNMDLGVIAMGKYKAYIKDRYLCVEAFTNPAASVTSFGPTNGASATFTKNLLAPAPSVDNPAYDFSRAGQIMYRFNSANEVLRLTYVPPTMANHRPSVSAGTGSTPNYYDENTLRKTITRDEQFNEVIEYKDKEGRVILKRVQVVPGNVSVNDTNYAGTYYLYDDRGNLMMVLPPEAMKRITALFTEH